MKGGTKTGGSRGHWYAALLATAFAATLGCHSLTPISPARTPRQVVVEAARPKLVPFASDAELERFLSDYAAARGDRYYDEYARSCSGCLPSGAPAKASCVPVGCDELGCGVHPNGCGGTVNCGPCKSAGAPAADPAAEAPAAAEPSPAPDNHSFSDEAVASESITNVQHAGVDEGSIVKLQGDFLIVLRRGRLFTIKIGRNALQPISSADAFAPGIDPSGDWYDEMLVSKNHVIVIGYSYARGGTEIGLFDLDERGRLKHRDTHHLRSNDYYSSRNYASRLIGDKLIFYSPLHLNVDGDDLYGSFPALRRWKQGNERSRFTRIVKATDVYRPILSASSLTLHSVTVCNLALGGFNCGSTVVMGPAGRVFYVSPESVYIWVSGESDGSRRGDTLLYRMPLNGSRPSVLRVSGSPVDQFSFLEKAGHLNVLLRAEADGDGMWRSQVSAGDTALMRVPLKLFSNRADPAPSSAYTELPSPHGYTLQNRFVGDYVLYGTGNGWGDPGNARSALFAYRFAGGGSVTKLPLKHGVDRIEALGKDAVVVGTDGKDLHFAPVALGELPWLAPRYTRKNAAQGELRSHGFFYRSDGPRAGVIGLPIRDSGAAGYSHLVEGSASVLYLKNRGLSLRELGTLVAHPESPADDGCRASCVDWYGNSRPIFAWGRLFALLGYELVEGKLERGRVRETRRVSFAPRAALRRAR